jgi:DNA-binding NtrC family response regulator
MNIKSIRAQAEREVLIRALSLHGCNMVKAAKWTGLSLQTFRNRMQRLDVSIEKTPVIKSKGSNINADEGNNYGNTDITPR